MQYVEKKHEEKSILLVNFANSSEVSEKEMAWIVIRPLCSPAERQGFIASENLQQMLMTA